MMRKQASVPHLFAPTDPVRGTDPLWLADHLPRGSAIIFRHYEWSHDQRLQLAKTLVRRARANGILVLVAGDPHLALCAGADGFHAPEALAHRILTFRKEKPHGLCTMAAHGTRGLVRAQQFGADAVLLSMVFASGSHAETDALGITRFTALATSAATKVIALGGISAKNVARLRATRHDGIAVIGAIGDFTATPPRYGAVSDQDRHQTLPQQCEASRAAAQGWSRRHLKD